MKNELYLFLLICCVACTNADKKSKTDASENTETAIKTIDLSRPKFSDDRMLLSDLVEDAEYIKLDSPDGALIKAGRTYLDEDYIYILNDVVYLFSRKDGSFVRKVGKIGQGPGEFKMARNFDIANKKIYLRLNWQDKIFIYSSENSDFLGEINCTSSSSVIFAHPNQVITLLRNIPSYEKQFSFMNINLSGDTILFKSPEIKLSDEIVKNSPGGRGYLPSINSGWKANGCFNFYDSMTDSIYAVSGDGYQARYQIFRGDYGMSPKKYFSTEWGKTISEKG